MKGRPVLFFLFCFMLFFLYSGRTLSPSIPEHLENHNLACELFIQNLIVDECSYNNETGNTSKTIVAVFVRWVDIPPGDQIIVELQGQSKFIDPFDINCPDFVTFVLTADGSIENVTVSTVSGTCPTVVQPIILPMNCNPPICLSGVSTGGKIFKDFNGDGIQDPSENGISDVPIKIYGNDVLLDQTTSMTNGIWATDNIAPGLPIRVEFDVPGGLFDGGPGSESNTRVQIAQSGQCDISLGIIAVKSFVDANPWVATTCFAKGAVLGSNTVGQEPTVVLNKYFTPNGGPRTGPNGNFYVANALETGSIWGLAYQKESQNLFAAAFLKRQAAWGPHGLGAIYNIDLSTMFPDPPNTPGYRYFGRTSLLLNLDDFGIETGDESSITRDLPSDPRWASHDQEVFDLIAKWGLGDMDISDGGDTLYVVNLYNRSLVIIDIGNPIQLPITADRVTEIPIPDPGCVSSDDWRPWGLKYRDGTLYVGGVCSAESTQDSDDLTATIFKYKNQIFELFVDFNLHYPKGHADNGICKEFIPWTTDFNKYKAAQGVSCGPSPLFCDIEFDSYGNLILGLGDRFGYQSGGRDYGPIPGDNTLYLSFTAGDLLRLHDIKGVPLLEKNATSGFITTAGANNNQGVCGGEFYYQDAFASHQESVLGGLAVHPSYNTVIATIMDPSTIWANGWSQFDNSNGQKKVSYSIYVGEFGTFGKSAGLGDIELLIGSSTKASVNVAIGNYVWIDEDMDGIQDPDENPVVDLAVILYDENGIELINTLTNNEGQYYFKDILPETKYYVVLGQQSDYVNGALIVNGLALSPTLINSRAGFGNQNNDSNAEFLNASFPTSLQNRIGLVYTTKKNNENDFSLDFGLLRCHNRGEHDLTLDVCENDSIFFMDRWFSSDHLMDTLVIADGAAFGCDSIIYIEVNVLNKTTSQLDTSICPGEMVQIGNVVFDENNRTGNVTFSGANQFGCDSIVEVEIEILEEGILQLDTSICPGEMVQIGNEIFDENNTTGIVTFSGANQFGCDSIVEVEVEILEEGIFQLDTSICPGEIVQIGNEIFDENNRTGMVTFSGANQYGCDSIVEIQIDILAESIFQLDTSICPREIVEIGNVIFDENNRSGTVTLSGANQFGCDSFIRVNVTPLEESFAMFDTVLCPGEVLTIGNETFNETRRSGMITFSGQNQHGCDSILEVQIDYPQNLLDIQPVYEIQYGDSVQLMPFWRHQFVQFEWTPNQDLSCVDCEFPWASPLKTTDYFLTGIDENGCVYTTKTKVIVIKEKRIFIPNVFTPNGDGLNDFFTLYANPFLEIIEELLIFDRWGNYVARLENIDHSHDPSGWDGYFRGELMNPAVFVYVAKVRWKDGERGTYSGDVTLVR